MQKKRQARDWWLSARVGPENDGRRKITEEDKDYMRKLHKQGEPVREIARIFQGLCSRRAIQFVLYPERLERVKKRAIEVKRWNAWNTTDRRREIMRKHRAKIRKVHGLPAKS